MPPSAKRHRDLQCEAEQSDNTSDRVSSKKRKSESSNTLLENSETVSQLLALLDFTDSSVSSSSAIILSRFNEIASRLLNEICISSSRLDPATSQAIKKDDANLELSDELYELLEVEFYFIKAESHDDPFAHGHEEQKKSAQWYFHRAPKRSSPSNSSSSNNQQPQSTTPAGGYRGGTRKGLDLTFGSPVPLASTAVLPVRVQEATASPYFSNPPSSNPIASSSSTSSPQLLNAKFSRADQSNIRGGILLRTIRRLSDGKVISGPSLLVDELLRHSGAATLAELVNDVWRGNISAIPLPGNDQRRPHALFLVPKPAQENNKKIKVDKVYRSPRIGLELSNPSTRPLATDPRVIFVGRPYRYFTNPHLLTANGRMQTFLGLYDELDQPELGTKDRHKHIVDGLERLAGIKTATAKKYIEIYESRHLDSTSITASPASVLKPFIGPKGKGAASSAASFLQMMAAVRCVLSEGTGPSGSI